MFISAISRSMFTTSASCLWLSDAIVRLLGWQLLWESPFHQMAVSNNIFNLTEIFCSSFLHFALR